MSLTIELSGVGCVNLGAELMLETAIAQLRARYLDVRLVVAYRLPAAYRRKRNLFTTRPADRVPGPIAAAFRLLPETVGRPAGFLPRSAIDVTLDMSGFAYGDDWPLAKMKNRLGLPALREPQPVILMPQAFGPFTKPAHAETMCRLVDAVPLIFARDEVSLDHLRALEPARADRIHLAPDFTNLLVTEPIGDVPENLALIVPNVKVIEFGGSAESYVRFLRQAADRLVDSGMKVSLLIHETASDRPIAEAVNAAGGTPLDIIEPGNAIEAKRWLASARCVVSSRFHALVGALSSGVPTLACGWSHKYAELLGDYGIAQHMIDLSAEADWDARIDALLTLARGDGKALRAAAKAQKERSTAMWDRVFEEIDAVHSDASR